MTNEKLGVLLVDVPEPRFWKYVFVAEFVYNNQIVFSIGCADLYEDVVDGAYHYTAEEAQKYPQFRWVALEDL
ncbi:TPA: hypothetical protein ACGORX_001228 [Streptococcus suis]